MYLSPMLAQATPMPFAGPLQTFGPMLGGPPAPLEFGCPCAQQQRFMMMQMLALMEGILGLLSQMMGMGGELGQALGMPGLAGFPGQQGGLPGFPTPAGGFPAGAGAPPGGMPASGLPPANGMSPGVGQADPELVNKLPGPLKPLAPVFQDAGQKYGIDPKFLAAISMLETGRGTSNAFRNKNNAMGVSDRRGPISFSNPADSIYRMAQTLANPRGPYRGANTINGIGRIYAPPGAGNDPNGTNGYWATGVGKYYRMLGGDPSQAVIRR